METLEKKREDLDYGFFVGPTVNPCTKGLWIWKEVFYCDSDT